MSHSFERDRHVFRSPAFRELIQNSIEFLNKTPLHSLPPTELFIGTGVYALYYLGNFIWYRTISEQNKLNCQLPIYVGKAVPPGWRQARRSNVSESTALFSRLREHSRSIAQVENLELDDFLCRFMILGNDEVDLIGTVEANLIRLYKPLWNTKIDGFGNHDPGIGRYNQAKSEWDTLHPGRPWAERLAGKSANFDNIIAKIQSYETE